SEVLSADCFGAFEDAGLDDPAKVAEVGKRFQETFLALGGGKHPMDVFVDFRGRKPNSDALIRHNGLSVA
ncbi:MAG: M3 family metallopeptidase, partial [Planctomycetota bacterium]